jgi:AraC-like DNA-binding protein
MHKTGDECFGLSVIQHWQPANLHALGFAWLASDTLKEALQRAERYIRVLNTHMTLSLQETVEGYEVNSFTAPPEYPQPSFAAVDAGMAILLHLCRLSYRADMTPLRIELRRPMPSCAGKFHTYFRSAIVYNSDRNMLLLDKHTIETLLPSGNMEIALSCDKIVRDYLAKLDRSDLIMQVKKCLIDNMSSEHLSEELVAGHLNMSLRNMQRKLYEKGSSYKALLDETRKELAEQYIKRSDYSFNEITYRLGFSEQSNFSRAFKRWTGKSPREYRRAG